MRTIQRRLINLDDRLFVTLALLVGFALQLIIVAAGRLIIWIL